MKVKKTTISDVIRTAVAEAARLEVRKQPFNLSGRGHEPRVTLDRRLAQILKGQNIPSVYISGYGANHHYALRMFKTEDVRVLVDCSDSRCSAL